MSRFPFCTDRRTIRTSVIVVGVIALMSFYFIADPGGRLMPKCIFLATTGFQCPGCGAQRMLHALLHGDVAGAWQYNPFLLLMLPILIFMVWLETQRTRRSNLYMKFYSVPLIVAMGMAVAGWFVVRNFLL